MRNDINYWRERAEKLEKWVNEKEAYIAGMHYVLHHSGCVPQPAARGDPQAAAEAFKNENREFQDILLDLRVKDNPNCWCHELAPCHSPACQRARVLLGTVNR